MKLVIDIDDNTYTHLFNSGMEIVPQVGEILLAVKNGKPYEERKGKWIINNRYSGVAHCSECGRTEDIINLSRYCSNCGAKMEKVEDLTKMEDDI